ncbi:SeqA protein [Salmonella enterica subsp. enterica]|uniref:SeqA protein n=1 Tax=Salmonella enterica I TaxID=59201 RepID=A0A447MW21_SALET|nr:SeqA protein [Salmonella enterica subsp. enterica]
MAAPRVYFAADEQTLLKNGNQTKPKHVPGTPYWVITNTNTGRKCSMIEHIMPVNAFPAELIEKVCGTILILALEGPGNAIPQPRQDNPRNTE